MNKSLCTAIEEHIKQEKVSFHTPGHKGYGWQTDGSFTADPLLKEDVSESIPGMDELAYPSGVLDDLEKRAAKVWGAETTLISVNGATAGIIAAILMLSRRGTHLLVPRNCHRSVVHGLILSGLQPIWFEPEWNGNNKHAALNCGADIVANSLHKTLSCPTQTGLIHLTKKAVEQYGFSASELRACLSLIQSSSPNYFFMPSQIVPTREAIGQISAECLAPCPPGWAHACPRATYWRRDITI